ncbi:MAG: hypothetical protein ACRCWS_05745 [Propionibacteriaceae bacterium]
MITASYPEIRASAPEVAAWARRPVHDPELWIGVFGSEALIGYGVADTDNESSPEHLYRSCGFAGDDIWHIYR